VGLLNINGFFDPIIDQIDKMIEEGYIKPQNKNLLIIDATVEGLMHKMNQYKAPEKVAVIQKVVH
jgi:predicted Rossmann-fold nucleotide-binding protein